MILENRVILITGAAGGLGSTAALEFAKHGAVVILLDKNLPKLEKVYDTVLEQGGVEPILYPFDLAGASENDYSELAQRIDEKYGMLHGLVHGAVELSAFTPLIQFGTKEWGHTLNVNVNAPFILTRELLPVMQKAPQASIVFISDSSARLAPAYSGAYGVSKVAMEGLASVLAQELEGGEKIRVNTLIPCPIDSPLRRRAYPAEDKSKLPPMTALHPLFRYLLSDESIGVTGQLIDAQHFLH
ncbi:MAG: NAD(P)-dependent oxidoreductase [Pseudomonadota bacterium]|nr:NAD(P)-dependent oxidoreductase [Pseudomonadota bacterium]